MRISSAGVCSVLAGALSVLIFPTSVFADSLPAPWQQTDIGAVGIAGSASEDFDGDLNLAGAGSDIWGTADSFHFVYQPLDDGTIQSNPPAQSTTNPYAKIGLMIRLTLDPGSPHVILDIKPDGGVEFMTRTTAGGTTTFIAGDTFTGDACGLQLIRQSGTVTAVVCHYTNGSTHYRTLGSVSFPTGMAWAGAAITSHDATVLNRGQFPASPPTVSTVPAPWYSFDQGNVGLAGSAFFENGTFTIQGAGADIWGTTEAFHYVRGCLAGDGEIVARVTSEQASNIYAKAGLLIQDLSTTGDPTVLLDVRPTGDVEFMARQTPGGTIDYLGGTIRTFPVWLKLVRTGNQFVPYTSSDGTAWAPLATTATATMQPAACVDAGMAVTSHDTTSLNTSSFDHVFLASQANMDVDVGDVGIAGSSTFVDAANQFSIQGAGADIWGTSDAFNFFYRAFVGDGQMTVRVDSLKADNTYAKAGLMIRESSNPSAATVILDARPDGSLEFMARNALGQSMTFIATASASFPLWLKLERLGAMVTGSWSVDGTTWATVGTASPTLASDALAGLAVASHERGVLATGGFDGGSFTVAR